MLCWIPTRMFAEGAVALAQGTGASALGPEVRSLVLLGGIVDVVVVAVLAVLVVQQRRLAASGAPAAHFDARWRHVLAAGLALPLLLISIVLIASAHTVTGLGGSSDDQASSRVDRSAVIGLP